MQEGIIRKFEKCKVYLSFKNNIWGTDLGDMQLISKFNKVLQFLLFGFDIYCKYALVIALKYKKSIAALRNLTESNHKPNKIWVDKGSEFCNRSMTSWLEDNGKEMHSTHNKGKSVVAERFITTLKIKSINIWL